MKKEEPEFALSPLPSSPELCSAAMLCCAVMCGVLSCRLPCLRATLPPARREGKTNRREDLFRFVWSVGFFVLFYFVWQCSGA